MLFINFVARAFIPNDFDLPAVHHIDNDPTNNEVENLMWITMEYNTRYSYLDGSRKLGTENPQSKLTEEDIRYIRKYYKRRDSEFGIYAMARKFGVSHSTIEEIIKFTRYKDVV